MEEEVRWENTAPLRVCSKASCPQGGSERGGTPRTSELPLLRAEGGMVFTKPIPSSRWSRAAPSTGWQQSVGVHKWVLAGTNKRAVIKHLAGR